MSMAAVATTGTCPLAHEPKQTLPLTSLLEQLRDLIAGLPPSVYRASPAPRVSGSVGEHVRHCLDHVSALVSATAGGELSYDRRIRGTTIETDPRTAVTEIERLVVRIDRLPSSALDRTVTLSTLLELDHPPLAVRSTVARELAFVIQHTIHHCALIAVLLEWQGWRVPHGFGVAPSTVRARAVAG